MHTLHITHRVSGSCLHVTLGGTLDLSSSPGLRQTLTSVWSDDLDGVHVDLSGLEAMDSTGMQAIVHLHERAVAAGQRVSLTPGQQSVRRVFDLCGLTALLPFDPPAR